MTPQQEKFLREQLGSLQADKFDILRTALELFSIDLEERVAALEASLVAEQNKNLTAKALVLELADLLLAKESDHPRALEAKVIMLEAKMKGLKDA